jgi:hypothetical protein
LKIKIIVVFKILNELLISKICSIIRDCSNVNVLG